MSTDNSFAKKKQTLNEEHSTPHSKLTSELIKDALLDNCSKSSLKATEIMFMKEGETVKYDPITSTEEITKQYKCSFTIKRQVLKTGKKSTAYDNNDEENRTDLKSEPKPTVSKPQQLENPPTNLLNIFNERNNNSQSSKILPGETQSQKEAPNQVPKYPSADDKQTRTIVASFRSNITSATEPISSANLSKLDDDKHINDDLKRKSNNSNKDLEKYSKEMKDLLEKKIDAKKQMLNISNIESNPVPNIFSNTNKQPDQKQLNPFSNTAVNNLFPTSNKPTTNIFQNTDAPSQRPSIFNTNLNNPTQESKPSLFSNPFANAANKGLFNSSTQQPVQNVFSNPFSQKTSTENTNPFKGFSTNPAPFKSIFDGNNVEKAPFTNPEDDEEDGEKDIEELNKEIPIESSKPMANVKFEELKKESTQISKLPVEKLLIIGGGSDKTLIKDGNIFLESIKNSKLIIFRNNIGTILFQGVVKPGISTIELTNNKSLGTWALMVKGVTDLNTKSLKILKFSIADIQSGEKYIMNVFNPFLKANSTNSS